MIYARYRDALQSKSGRFLGQVDTLIPVEARGI